MRIPLLLLALAIAARSAAQAGTHHDVAVIVNLNSPASVTIGDYFMTARGIPASRRIAISTAAANDIDSAGFEALRAQVETGLIQSGALDSINYIVTTMGVPVRVVQADCDSVVFQGCRSVDGELALILGPFASQVGQPSGMLSNPYYQSAFPFSRSATGLFLVTRLAATTVPDVLALIDRSGSVAIDPASALIAADDNFLDLAQPPSTALYEILAQITEPFASGPWTVELAPPGVRLDSLEGVIAYLSIGSGDGFVPSFDWLPGAIYLEGLSHTALAYQSPGSSPHHAQLAKAVSAGATGARGTVSMFYSGYLAGFGTTLLSYLDTTYRMNLGESLLAGLHHLRSGHVFIGDPKTRISYADPFASIGQAAAGGLNVVPNPSDGLFLFSADGKPLSSAALVDMGGRRLPLPMPAPGLRFAADARHVPPGAYVLEARMADGSTARARVVIAR